MLTVFFVVDRSYIAGIDLYITDKYVTDTYKSCAGVYMPSIGMFAISVICGPWGASCTPHK